MSVRDVPRMDLSAEVLSGISCVEEERDSVLDPSVRVGTFGAFAKVIVSSLQGGSWVANFTETLMEPANLSVGLLERARIPLARVSPLSKGGTPILIQASLPFVSGDRVADPKFRRGCSFWVCAMRVADDRLDDNAADSPWDDAVAACGETVAETPIDRARSAETNTE